MVQPLCMHLLTLGSTRALRLPARVSFGSRVIGWMLWLSRRYTVFRQVESKVLRLRENTAVQKTVHDALADMTESSFELPRTPLPAMLEPEDPGLQLVSLEE